MTSESTSIGRLIGYARISTQDQQLQHQETELINAGCSMVFSDVMSGIRSRRPQLEACLFELQPGDTLVITRFDRLGRSVVHLYSMLKDFKERDILLRSLREDFDTSTPAGKMLVGFFAIFAEFEYDLAQERSRHGIAAARQRGSLFGNPRFRNGDQEAICQMKATQAATFLERSRIRSRPWIGYVKDMRPHNSWNTVHRYIKAKLPADQVPTMETMVSMVRKLVRAGDLDGKILHRAGSTTNESAAEVARRIAVANPNMSLREIGDELQILGINPARARTWSAMTVSRLLKAP